MLDKIKYSWYRFKFRNGQYLPLTAPVDVSLELAAMCNQTCVYCYWAEPDNLPFKKGFMTYDIGHKIITEAADLGVNSLKFNWRGESTLNPEFKRLTGLAKSLAHGSTFMDRLSNSNFKFNIKREDIFEGLANQTKVKVSMDSFIKEVFETQRAGGKHDITLNNIEKFYNHPARIKSETVMVIQAVRTAQNADEDLYSEVKRRWPEALVSIRDMVGGRRSGDYSSLENISRDFAQRQPCKQAFVRIIFNHAGSGFPCCPDIKEELKIGDIKSQSLRSIFTSEAARQLRKQLKSGKAFEKDPCKSCSSFESFKGTTIPWDS